MRDESYDEVEIVDEGDGYAVECREHRTSTTYRCEWVTVNDHALSVAGAATISGTPTVTYRPDEDPPGVEIQV